MIETPPAPSGSSASAQVGPVLCPSGQLDPLPEHAPRRLEIAARESQLSEVVGF